MSAAEVTSKIMTELETALPDFICLNYANADMVGHTGVFEAAIKAADEENQRKQYLLVQAEKKAAEEKLKREYEEKLHRQKLEDQEKLNRQNIETANALARAAEKDK